MAVAAGRFGGDKHSCLSWLVVETSFGLSLDIGVLKRRLGRRWNGHSMLCPYRVVGGLERRGTACRAQRTSAPLDKNQL